MDGGPPVFPRGFTCPAVLWIQLTIFGFRIRDYHPLWLTFPRHSPNLSSSFAVRTPDYKNPVWPVPRSLATTNGISFDVFSSPYLDVSVQAVPHIYLWIQYMLAGYGPAGFPHSEICGSERMCRYPQLIAACHVLLRLLMPRHSPCALCSLIINYAGKSSHFRETQRLAFASRITEDCLKLYYPKIILFHNLRVLQTHLLSSVALLFF